MSVRATSTGQKGRRLLFLAYFFPPVRTVAALRTYNMAKNLARTGWRITVVSPAPHHWNAIDLENRVRELESLEGFRRVTTGHRHRFLDPEHLNCWNTGLGYLLGGTLRRLCLALDVERQIGWLAEARKVCRQFGRGDFDLILASGGPFISFRLAKELSESLGSPYALDYRDLWTGNPHAQAQHHPGTVRREKAIYEGSSAVLAVSPAMQQELINRFGGAEKTFVLTNGFDSEELQTVIPEPFGHFAMVYAGIFYRPMSSISPVMEALRRLKSNPAVKGRGWFFHYYGPDGRHVRDEATRCGVLDHVVDHGVVPRAKVLSAVAGADTAVVITSLKPVADRAARGIVTGKIFEPLGLGTPVLLIAPEGSDAADILRATGTGRQFHGEEPAAIASYLAFMMSTPGARAPVPTAYSWKELGAELDEILRRATGAADAAAPYRLFSTSGQPL